MPRITKKQQQEIDLAKLIERRQTHYEYYAKTIREFAQRYNMEVVEFCVVNINNIGHTEATFMLSDGVKYNAIGVGYYEQPKIKLDIDILESLSRLIPYKKAINFSETTTEIDYDKARFIKRWSKE